MAKRNKAKKPGPPVGPPGVLADAPGGPGRPAGAWDPRTLLVLAVLGLVARVALAVVSWGTNDAYTFYRFAVQVDLRGLPQVYRQDPELNHPPIPSYWAWLAYRLTRSGPPLQFATTQPATGPAAAGPFAKAAKPPADHVPGHSPAASSTAPGTAPAQDQGPTSDEWFSFVFKLPVILADGVTTWLLWRLWRRRGADPTYAAGVAAAWAWSLCSILVSGYHCNTDPVYAMLCLLSADLLARDRPGWAGAALGAAINVKLVPVLLIPPLLLACRRRGDMARFVAGLSLGAVPFLPLLVAVGPTFYQNVLAYSSRMERWGLNFFLIPLAYGSGDTLPDDPTHSPLFVYYVYGKYLILALVVAWSAAARWWGRWAGRRGPYERAAVALAILLVFAPGFGVQYTIMPLPLLFAVRPRFAALYGTAAGLFLGLTYFLNWTGDFPLYSMFGELIPWPAAWVGAAAWGLLVYFLVRAAGRKWRSDGVME